MATDEESSGLVQYRCEMCNAPYPLGADDVISTCPYCGYTFTVGGSEMKEHLLLSNKLTPDEVKEVVADWIRFAASKSVGTRFTREIEIGTPSLQWIPTFRVNAKCDTYHFGADQKGSGNSKRWEKVEARDSTQTTEWVLARRHAATFGIQELIESLDDSGAQAFDIKLTDQASVLNSEIGEDDAPVRARHQKSERDRADLNDKVTKLLDYRLDMKADACTYVHAPYWLVRYEHRGGTFRVAVSGATGKVVLGELPVTKIGSALLFQGTPYITYAIFAGGSSDGDAALIPIAMVAIGGILFLAAYMFVGKALGYEIELTADAKERVERFSFTGSIKGLEEKIG
jgi:DNA-directed RNA polymerase subunit RPC12/RpoP